MLRALVTGDFHIAEQFDLDQIERLLDIVAEEANKRDELWILGDVFHRNKVTPLELLLFVNFLKKITVPIILLAGNHDMNAENSLVDWVSVAFPITVSRTSLVIEREGVKILLGHFNVEESVMGAYDYRLTSGVAADTLDVPLALLGHIHKSQRIQGAKTQVVHPGSLFYIDFNERNDKKALVDLTLDKGTYKVEHIELSPDPIVQLEVTPEVDPKILEDYPSNCRVKIVVHYSDPTLNKREVVRKFDPYMFKDKKISFVYNTPLSSIKKSAEAVAEDLTTYLQKNASPEIMKLILDLITKENV